LVVDGCGRTLHHDLPDRAGDVFPEDPGADDHGEEGNAAQHLADGSFPRGALLRYVPRRRASLRVPALWRRSGSGSRLGEFLEVASVLPAVEAVAPDPHVLPVRKLREPRLQIVEREWP